MANDSEWLQKQQKASKKAKYIVSAIGIIVLLAVIGGVAYGFLKKSKSGSSNPSGANGTFGNVGENGNGTPEGDDGSVPEVYYTYDKREVDLKITPDPKLKKSFWGMNYGPIMALYPWCTNTLGDTIEDMKIVSQLTNNVRVYGMDCNMANYTLVAMKKLGLNHMSLIPTIWVDKNETTYARQEKDLFDMIKEHGVDMIAGVSVGNEVLFRKEVTAEDLFSRIAAVREKINGMGFKKTIPVFTSDLGSNVEVDGFVDANDVIMANVHPYFGGLDVEDSGEWTFKFYNDFDVEPAEAGNKEAVMSEIGWPTRGESNRQAEASLDNLQTFLKVFLCQANNDHKIKYYYFEMFDTPWKEEMFTVLEGAWGLFTKDKELKEGVEIPDCAPVGDGFRDFS